MKIVKCPSCGCVMVKKEDVIYLNKFGECCGCQDRRADLDDFHRREMEEDAKEKGYASYKVRECGSK